MFAQQRQAFLFNDAQFSSIDMKFHQRFKAWRQSKDISVVFLASRSGVYEANIRMFEAGKRPASDAMLTQLASVPELGVTAGQLMAWRDQDKLKTPEEVKLHIQALIDKANALKLHLREQQSD